VASTTPARKEYGERTGRQTKPKTTGQKKGNLMPWALRNPRTGKSIGKRAGKKRTSLSSKSQDKKGKKGMWVSKKQGPRFPRDKNGEGEY